MNHRFKWKYSAETISPILLKIIAYAKDDVFEKGDSLLRFDGAYFRNVSQYELEATIAHEIGHNHLEFIHGRFLGSDDARALAEFLSDIYSFAYLQKVHGPESVSEYTKLDMYLGAIDISSDETEEHLRARNKLLLFIKAQENRPTDWNNLLNQFFGKICDFIEAKNNFEDIDFHSFVDPILWPGGTPNDSSVADDKRNEGTEPKTSSAGKFAALCKSGKIMFDSRLNPHKEKILNSLEVLADKNKIPMELLSGRSTLVNYVLSKQETNYALHRNLAEPIEIGFKPELVTGDFSYAKDNSDFSRYCEIVKKTGLKEADSARKLWDTFTKIGWENALIAEHSHLLSYIVAEATDGEYSGQRQECGDLLEALELILSFLPYQEKGSDFIKRKILWYKRVGERANTKKHARSADAMVELLSRVADLESRGRVSDMEISNIIEWVRLLWLASGDLDTISNILESTSSLENFYRTAHSYLEEKKSAMPEEKEYEKGILYVSNLTSELKALLDSDNKVISAETPNPKVPRRLKINESKVLLTAIASAA